MKQLVKMLVLLGLAFTLHGCIFVVGAAAGAAGIAIVYDHRSIASTLKDIKIGNTIVRKIRLVPELRLESHIEVTVFNRVVLLTGEAPRPRFRKEAEDLAKSTSGVKRIYNQISLQGPTSTLTRTSDSWITAKIKSEMLATSDLKSSSIKVLTENGIVYLMGIVSRQQADIAVEVTRQVSGVQKVVKIFQYKN